MVRRKILDFTSILQEVSCGALGGTGILLRMRGYCKDYVKTYSSGITMCDKDNIPMIQSVIGGKLEGRIYADNKRDPKTIVVITYFN